MNDPNRIRVALNANAPNEINITGWLERWLNGTLPNYGMTMETAGQGGAHHFGASENQWKGNGHEPFIRVTYVQLVPPTTVSPTNNATVMTDIPTLTWTPGVSDIGSHLWYWVRGSNSDNPELGGMFNSGWLDSARSWQPPPGTLQDGTTYSWYVAVSANDPSKHDPYPSMWWSNVAKFKFDRRLGDQSVSPMDDFGSVSVNLSNGNALYSTSSPSLTTVGGQLGMTYTYNSQSLDKYGLTAKYFPGCQYDTNNIPGNLTEPYIVRRERTVDINFANDPGPSVAQGHFCATSEGFVTVPSTGNY